MQAITVKAEVAALDRVTDFVNETLEALGCPMKTLMQIDLAVEEIFVNIASYAYGPEGGDAVIRVSAADGGVRVAFEDRGIPFDPTAREDPDRTAGAEERPIGGLGIFLTKKLMDAVAYEYRDGMNILTIEKKTGTG
ncbi:MAG: ATP-binding protein [Clostridia bacterium]|nr:ATP-binding protein [Clostridia bacterium]